MDEVKVMHVMIVSCVACPSERTVTHSDDITSACPACGFTYVKPAGGYLRGVLRIEERQCSL